MKDSWKTELGDALNRSVPLREPPPGLEAKILEAAAGGVQRRAFRFPWGFLAAAALLLLAFGNVVQWVSPKTSTVSMKPGLLVVMLSGTAEAPKAFGTIVLDPDDNHGILAVRDLPIPVGNRQYQLWLKKGSEVRGAGAFGVNADGYGSLLLNIPAGFRGFQEFFLTSEAAGGTSLPTSPAVMAGKF